MEKYILSYCLKKHIYIYWGQREHKLFRYLTKLNWCGQNSQNYYLYTQQVWPTLYIHYVPDFEEKCRVTVGRESAMCASKRLEDILTSREFYHLTRSGGIQTIAFPFDFVPFLNQTQEKVSDLKASTRPSLIIAQILLSLVVGKFNRRN